jgi:hypothetical protein
MRYKSKEMTLSKSIRQVNFSLLDRRWRIWIYIVNKIMILNTYNKLMIFQQI